MAKHEILFEWAFGAGYRVQPGHKPNIVPTDYLEAFCNVKPDDFDSVASFCKSYNFDPGWILTGEDLVKGFKKIHDTLAPVLKKVLVGGSRMTFNEVDVINQQLKHVHPHVGFLYPHEELWRRETNLQLWLLEASSGAKPEVTVTIQGHPDKSRNFHVDIVQTATPDPQSKWQARPIDRGISEVVERFAEQADWEAIEPYVPDLMLHPDSKMTFSKERGVERIVLRLEMGKANQIYSHDLVARMASPSPAAHLSYMFWEAVKAQRRLGKFRLCRVCGDLYRGRSKNYCSKPACKREWTNAHNQRRYNADPAYRARKQRKKSNPS